MQYFLLTVKYSGVVDDFICLINLHTSVILHLSFRFCVLNVCIYHC